MNRFNVLFFTWVALFASASLFAQEAAQKVAPQIAWAAGPTSKDLCSNAALKVPAGFIYAGAADARKIMEYYGNPPTNMECGYIEPSTNADWFVVFEFRETGYIPDDEKNDLDADAILESYREGNEEGNRWRREKGEPELQVVGWKIKPHYEAATNTLEWAIIFSSNGNQLVNYNIRLLGRRGVMEATIVLAPEKIDAVVPRVKQVLTGYEFKEGERYADFREGDNVAEYGLAALAAGGAAAVAAKTGLLAGLLAFLRKGWYIILAGLAGLGKWLSGLFGRNKGADKPAND